MRYQLIDELEAYQPFNEQEEKDRRLIINALKTEEDIFLRKNLLYHMTASAWVVNKTRDKALMAYHNIYNSWAWLGGHADGEADLLKVALKEVEEESGLTNISPVTSKIFSVEVLVVDGHMKNKEYVSSHLHFNVTYLIEADEKEKLIVKEDENSNLSWFSLEEAVEASTEPWLKENIYAKMNEKLKRMK